jgi:hypothetical protein
MKKKSAFLLGLLVILLAMGFVLAGCSDDGSGDNGSNNSGSNNSGNNNSGGSQPWLVLTVRNEGASTMQVEVYDANGLRQVNISSIAYSSQASITTLAPGSYNVRVTAQGNTFWYPSSSQRAYLQNNVLLRFTGSALVQ